MTVLCLIPLLLIPLLCLIRLFQAFIGDRIVAFPKGLSPLQAPPCSFCRIILPEGASIVPAADCVRLSASVKHDLMSFPFGVPVRIHILPKGVREGIPPQTAPASPPFATELRVGIGLSDS